MECYCIHWKAFDMRLSSANNGCSLLTVSDGVNFLISTDSDIFIRWFNKFKSLFLFRRFEALEAPLAERRVELEEAFNFYQFQRDIQDEHVSIAFKLYFYHIDCCL